jgi:PIN domain nuclease of toxin-antitoxin system
MIVLDTHIWVWWVNGSADLAASKSQILSERQANGLGVSVISRCNSSFFRSNVQTP